MNELTELQLKAFVSLFPSVPTAGGLEFSTGFSGAGFPVLFDGSQSALSEILAAADNSEVALSDLGVLAAILIADGFDLVGNVHNALRKWAASINEPLPVMPDVPSELAQEFAGYLP